MAVGSTAGAGTRRIVYGLNVALQAVIAIAILIFAIYIAQRFNKQIDLTRSGVNSLSQSSRQLLRGLEQPIKITALYGTSRKKDTEGEAQIGQLRDLLLLYDDIGGRKVSTFVVDPVEESARVKEIILGLREKPLYKNDAEPYRLAIEEGAPLVVEITELATTELEKLRELASTNPQLENVPGYVDTRTYLAEVQRSGERLSEELDGFADAEMPPYGRTSKAINEFSARALEFLKYVNGWMERSARSIPTASIDLKQWFTNAPQRMLDPIARLEQVKAMTAALKPVKIEELFAQMQGTAPVIVESDDEAIIVPQFDLWQYLPRDPQAPDEPPERVFEGEAVISSAILRLTQKEKTGVVFVRYGGTGIFDWAPEAMAYFAQQGMNSIPATPYEGLGTELQRRNFVHAEWDVKSSPTPPVLEDVVRTIYVVMPPTPPPPPQPNRPPTNTGMSQADVTRVTDAIASAGHAIFLAGWQKPTVSGLSALGSYAYADYLEREWGISAEIDQLVVPFAENPREDGYYVPRGDPRSLSILRSPQFFELTDHPITAPVQEIPIGLVLTCPLVPAELEDGVATPAELESLGRVTDKNSWGVIDPERALQELSSRDSKGLQPQADAVRAPFDVITLATKTIGDAEQSIIVVGAQEFIADQIAQQRTVIMTEAGPKLVALNPGNVDFLLNALHFMAGNVDRIAAGPRGDDVPRIQGLSDPEAQAWTNAFLAGIWPAFALLIGGVVWFFRRR